MAIGQRECVPGKLLGEVVVAERRVDHRLAHHHPGQEEARSCFVGDEGGSVGIVQGAEQVADLDPRSPAKIQGLDQDPGPS